MSTAIANSSSRPSLHSGGNTSSARVVRYTPYSASLVRKRSHTSFFQPCHGPVRVKIPSIEDSTILEWNLVPQRDNTPAQWQWQIDSVPRAPTIYIIMTGQTLPGVRLDYLAHRRVTLAHENDPVMTTGMNPIQLVISWTGYKDIFHTIKLVTANGHLTRGQLAHNVASHILRQMERMQYEVPSCGSHGVRFGLNGINPKNLYIRSIWNAFQDTWMVELYTNLPIAN